MSSTAQFKTATEIVGKLPKDGPVKPSQEDQLTFYAHYKQATVGDVSGKAPGMFDFVAKAKYNAWKAIEGMDKETAEKIYVDLLKKKLEEADDEDSKKSLAELEAAGKA